MIGNLTKAEREQLYTLAPFYKAEGREDFPITLFNDTEIAEFTKFASQEDLKMFKDRLMMISRLAGRYWIKHRQQERLIDFKENGSGYLNDTEAHVYNTKHFLLGKHVPLIPIFSKLIYWENCFNKAVNPPAINEIQKQCLTWVNRIEKQIFDKRYAVLENS